jgi:hypothetical protein
MKGLRPKCENFKEENDDLRSTAKAATTDQQFHYLTFLHVPYTGSRQPGQGNSVNACARRPYSRAFLVADAGCQTG